MRIVEHLLSVFLVLLLSDNLLGDVVYSFEPPQTHSVDDASISNDYGRVEGVVPIWLEGPAYRGKPTRVFAWVGLPPGASPSAKVPGMVCVHGGGGTAFAKWVKTWNERGYAAIAMDTCGKAPRGERDGRPHPGHDWSGPAGWEASFRDMDSPLTDQWPYHAVSAIIRANSYLRSLPEVDEGRIGITGISWGGYLTSVAAGIDSRFAFAAPVYGSGWYDLNPAVWGGGEKNRANFEKWLAQWDAKNYIPKIKCPVLRCNGDCDRYYTMEMTRRSTLAMTQAANSILSIKHKMGHGHPPTGDPKEIAACAGYYLGNCPKPLMITSQTLDSGLFAVAFATNADNVAKAELVFLVDDHCASQNREWTVREIDRSSMSADSVVAKIPRSAKMFYVNLTTDKGTVYSSSIQVRDVPQVVARVHQTPGGPRLFVDGKRHLARSLLVNGSNYPRAFDEKWEHHDIPFTAEGDAALGIIRFGFENKTSYGGVEKPDGWVRMRNLRVLDAAGAEVVPQSALSDEAAFQKWWKPVNVGTTGSCTLEPEHVIRLDLYKQKKSAGAGFSLETSFSRQFKLESTGFPLKPSRRYHLVFDAVASHRQFFTLQAAMTSPRFKNMVTEPDPFCEQVRLAAEHGVDIVIPNGAGAFYREDGTFDFSAADEAFGKIVGINPEALIVARFGVGAEKWMLDRHPGWKTTFSDGSTHPTASISCRPWREFAKKKITAIAEHLAERFPANFAGVHFAAGRCGEFIYEDMMREALGGYDVHTLKAWRDFLKRNGEKDWETAEVPPERVRKDVGGPELEPFLDPRADRRMVLFHQFLNEEMSGAVAEFAAAARRATKGQKLVMSFYGYTYELCGMGAESGHFNLQGLLDEAGDDIDVLCGPFSYFNRAYPDTRPVMSASETMRRHGVMWWNEDDTRTHLETDPDALQANNRIVPKKDEIVWSLERNNRQNARRGDGYWWMDLRGRGWFMDEDLWEVMDRTRPYEERSALSNRSFQSDVSMVVSEKSVNYRRSYWGNGAGSVSANVCKQLELLEGDPLQYLLADFLEGHKDSRYVFFTDVFFLDRADREALKRLRQDRPDQVRVWFWAPGYVSEDGSALENVREATGFRVKKLPMAQRKFKRDLLYVEPDDGDVVLERYSDGKAAVVAHPLGSGGYEVFYGPISIKLETIRSILGL